MLLLSLLLWMLLLPLVCFWLLLLFLSLLLCGFSYLAALDVVCPWTRRQRPSSPKCTHAESITARYGHSVGALTYATHRRCPLAGMCLSPPSPKIEGTCVTYGPTSHLTPMPPPLGAWFSHALYGPPAAPASGPRPQRARARRMSSPAARGVCVSFFFVDIVLSSIDRDNRLTS